MSDPIPYVNLGAQTAPNKEKLLKAVEKVIDSGNYILGSETQAFEKEFATYCQVEHALGVANGTCALHLALSALGVGEGDEVITAPNSFIASAASIALVRAKPVFCDIAPDLNIDPEKLEAAITPKTKAVIPVHLTGRPAQMTKILEIAKRKNILVLEDAAQAVGARLNGKRVGGFGEVACFSLHPLKNLYAFGDAGMVTVRDKAVLEQIQKARSHGFKNRNECDFFSFNCRLDEMQAAMLRIQLAHLEEWTAERIRLAHNYNTALAPYVKVPIEGPGEYCVYQTYVIRAERRDALVEHLLKHQVDTKIHYPIPIHLQKAAHYLGYAPDDFPETMKASHEIVSLPLYPGLREEQQQRVISLIKEFYAGSV